jgi:RNA polymerase primary sigma factor
VKLQAQDEARRLALIWVDDRLDDLFAPKWNRDLRMLRLRYGLIDGRCWTIAEISKEYGLTHPESSRQRIMKMIRMLRHSSRLGPSFCA